MPDEPVKRLDPDDGRRLPASDAPLSVSRQTPGPAGFRPKLGLAALGLLLIFAMVAGLWAASHYSRKGAIERAPSRIEIHP